MKTFPYSNDEDWPDIVGCPRCGADMNKSRSYLESKKIWQESFRCDKCNFRKGKFIE